MALFLIQEVDAFDCIHKMPREKKITVVGYAAHCRLIAALRAEIAALETVVHARVQADAGEMMTLLAAGGSPVKLALETDKNKVLAMCGREGCNNTLVVHYLEVGGAHRRCDACSLEAHRAFARAAHALLAEPPFTPMRFLASSQLSIPASPL